MGFGAKCAAATSRCAGTFLIVLMIVTDML